MASTSQLLTLEGLLLGRGSLSGRGGDLPSFLPSAPASSSYLAVQSASSAPLPRLSTPGSIHLLGLGGGGMGDSTPLAFLDGGGGTADLSDLAQDGLLASSPWASGPLMGASPWASQQVRLGSTATGCLTWGAAWSGKCVPRPGDSPCVEAQVVTAAGQPATLADVG